MYVISNPRIPIKIWANPEEIEDGAIDQINNVASMPTAYHHIALMPDAHQGYGMPIGGVCSLKGTISPNMVGVDIGCGMRALKTSLLEINKLKKIMSKIRQAIPVGFNHREEPCASEMPSHPSDVISMHIVGQEFQSATHQIGTLGGGNHFIEIQKGSDKHIWIMVHSGSRNIGLKVANYYNKRAKELNKRWCSDIDPKWDLAFLPADSEDGAMYISEMNYCLEFALANRRLMMQFIKEILTEIAPSIGFLAEYDIHHNYATMENHFGQNGWVHRKGATSAKKGELGIIPGSQGTASYIVEGLGNKESFMSCAHGAGRIMSRKKAKETLNITDVTKKLEEKGIIHSVRNRDDLDEAPEAYKSIDAVMANQADLVKIKVKLEPLAVIKG